MEVGRGRIKKREKQDGDKDRHRSVSSVNQESGHCSGYLNGFIDLFYGYLFMVKNIYDLNLAFSC